MRARYYDPATGQFLTRDPLTPITGTPYAYVGNEPMGGVDPSGLMSICLGPIHIGSCGGGEKLITPGDPPFVVGPLINTGMGPSGEFLINTGGTDLGSGRLITTGTPDWANKPLINVPSDVTFGERCYAEVVREGGVRVVINTRDHGPPHAHVLGGGPETRIGQNGKPLKGDPELSRKQQEIIDNNLGKIRRSIGASMRDYRNNKPI